MTHNKDIKLSVVIINWNTGSLLVNCLEALYAEIGGISNQVIVVDNNSVDDSLDKAKKLFPDCVYIDNKFNAGFTKANNQGFQKALGEYLLILNPDTLVQPGSIRKMIKFLEDHPKTGIVGGKLIFQDGQPQHSFYNFPDLRTFKSLVASYYLTSEFHQIYGNLREQKRATFLNRLGYLKLEKSQNIDLSLTSNNHQPVEIDYPIGACILARRNLLDEVGYFDELFFMYCQEMDWCYRVKKKGWLIYALPDAIIIHFGSTSLGKNIEKRFDFYSKDHYKFIRKHYGLFHGLQLLFLFYFFRNFFYMFIALASQWSEPTNPS